MGEARRKHASGGRTTAAKAAKRTEAGDQAERPMAIPEPVKNQVTVGQLLVAYGILGREGNAETAMVQIQKCEIDAGRLPEFLCILSEVEAKSQIAIQAWNKAPMADRVGKVFNAKITLNFQPFDCSGLLRSGTISRQAVAQLQPWLLKAAPETKVETDDESLSELAEWLKLEDAGDADKGGAGKESSAAA